MSFGELRPGQIVRLSTMKDRVGTENHSVDFSYSAGRGKQFVLVLVGREEKKDDGFKVDAEKALIAMGWTPTDRLASYLDEHILANEDQLHDLGNPPSQEDRAKLIGRLGAYRSLQKWLDTYQA